jgi:hypothetical protein
MRYVIDLDGTLCTAEYPDYTKAEPYTERIKFVNDLVDDGHYAIIDTARGNGSGEDWLARTAKQLDEWGLRFSELRVGHKPWADVYVDDRGVPPVSFFPPNI